MAANFDAQTQAILDCIEFLITDVVRKLRLGQSPEFIIPNGRSQGRVTERVLMASHKSMRRFAVVLRLLNIIHDLLSNNRVSTKREIFYSDVAFFRSQLDVDRNVDAIARLIGCPRWSLNVMATSKGLVAGNLIFDGLDGMLINCMGGPVPVPQSFENIATDAEFVLFVEKDATFQKLIDDGFLDLFENGILVTAKGFPDLESRRFVSFLNRTFNLPILVLCDADPHGLAIYLLLRWGSTHHSHISDLIIVPDAILIGLLPEEVASLTLPANQLLDLSAREQRMLHNFSQRNDITGDAFLCRQVEAMLQVKKKAEIEVLNALGHRFLIDFYLPDRIANVLMPFG